MPQDYLQQENLWLIKNGPLQAGFICSCEHLDHGFFSIGYY